MMRKQLFRLLLVPALVCTILGVGLLSTTGPAHAATLQAPVAQHAAQPNYNPGKNCTFGDAEMDDTTDFVYCFAQNGSYAGQGFAFIYILNTGLHTVTWDWEDCNGGFHHSSKGPRTIVTSSNSPGGFAGCTYMYIVYNVVLS